MIEVERAADLGAYVGECLGRSRPRRVDQTMIDAFGHLTGDLNWQHVEPERAASEMPDGKTIAHGLCVLALAPAMLADIYTIRTRGAGLNYGYDKVRFVRPVQVGADVHLALTVRGVSAHRLGTKLETLQEIKLGSGDTVVAAHNILLIKDAVA